MLRERLSESLKDAMRSHNQERVTTLRMIMAGIKDKDIAARPKVMDGVPDEDILGLLQTMIKQRRESIELYEKGGRSDLVEAEAAQIVIIEDFMPQQLGDGEVSAAILAAITAVSAASIRDMGKVMADLKAHYAGQMDFTRVSALVKEKLVKG